MNSDDLHTMREYLRQNVPGHDQPAMRSRLRTNHEKAEAARKKRDLLLDLANSVAGWQAWALETR
jgi:hypothetical protein